MAEMTAAQGDGAWSDGEDEMLAQVDLNTAEFVKVRSVSSKYSLECDKILESEGMPLQRYRPKYLVVSDLASQYWCEQQLLYKFSNEVYVCRVPVGEEVKIEETEDTKVAKSKGSDIHLARELEIQVPVEVHVVTKEDKWAVKFLNLLTAVQGLYSGRHLAREVPVFGCPFGGGMFVYGIIDQVQYDPTHHSLSISELKTRRSKFVPMKSHQEKDKFQLGIYRQLLDELIIGSVTSDMIGQHLQLDLGRPLSPDVVAHAVAATESFPQCNGAANEEVVLDLNAIMEILFTQIQSLTRVQSGTVEYVHQGTGETIGQVSLDRGEEEVRERFEFLKAWWVGERGTRGVEVEDCWKCRHCLFSPWCEWREVMAARTSKPWHQTHGNG